MRNRCRPQFICIGAQRAGTTWLYTQLRRHPNVFLPPLKELHYFDRDERYPTPNTLSERSAFKRLRNRDRARWAALDVYRGLRYRDWNNLIWSLKFHFGSIDDRWYVNLFPMSKSVCSGDITPGYSVLDEEGFQLMH